MKKKNIHYSKAVGKKELILYYGGSSPDDDEIYEYIKRHHGIERDKVWIAEIQIPYKEYSGIIHVDLI
jgi:hypothetical protein